MMQETDNSAPVRRSVGENLEDEAKVLRARLKDIEEALEALKSNPEIEHILNLVSKVANRY